MADNSKPNNFRQSVSDLASTIRDLRKPGGTPTSTYNATQWNKPGGGYDQWKANDASRGPQDPAPIPSPETQIKPRPIGSFKKGGKVKKTGIYKLHRGEKVLKAKVGKPKKMVRLTKLAGY